MLLSMEALWMHYKWTAPNEDQPLCQWHEEIKLSWGGLKLAGGMNMHQALGLQAQYAAQMMMPTMRPEVIAMLCKSLHPSKQFAILEKMDKEWGGNGSGVHLTALNYFTCNIPAIFSLSRTPSRSQWNKQWPPWKKLMTMTSILWQKNMTSRWEAQGWEHTSSTIFHTTYSMLTSTPKHASWWCKPPTTHTTHLVKQWMQPQSTPGSWPRMGPR